MLIMHEIKFDSALFAPDGELLGIKTWNLSELSPKWLGVCQSILKDSGKVFRYRMEQTLSHLELSLTSANGSGLGAFYAHGNIVLSVAYLRGEDLQSEDEVLQMFVSSLRQVNLVQKVQTDDTPFASIFGLKQRPLQIVVIWGNMSVSEQDQDLVFELSDHLAGAFLC